MLAEWMKLLGILNHQTHDYALNEVWIWSWTFMSALKNIFYLNFGVHAGLSYIMTNFNLIDFDFFKNKQISL